MNTFKVMFSFPFPIESEQANKQTMRHLFPKLSALMAAQQKKVRREIRAQL